MKGSGKARCHPPTCAVLFAGNCEPRSASSCPLWHNSPRISALPAKPRCLRTGYRPGHRVCSTRRTPRPARGYCYDRRSKGSQGGPRTCRAREQESTASRHFTRQADVPRFYARIWLPAAPRLPIPRTDFNLICLAYIDSQRARDIQDIRWPSSAAAFREPPRASPPAVT